MTSDSRTNSRKLLVAFCGIGLAAGIFSFRAQADPWDKKTILTVDKTIQVTDTVLPAGTYVLKLADSNANRHIVQIFNEDQSRIIDTVLAIPNYRLRPTGKSRFMFWETPPGAAPALRAWFYPGDNFGQEFRYPKQVAMLQTVEHTESSRMMNQSTTTEESTRTEARPTEEQSTEQSADRQITDQEEAMVTEQEAQREEPVQMAQSTPPPAPEPAQTTPQPMERPTTLPHTASPYPLFGLGGMFSLGLYGLLRLKRKA